MSLFCQAWYDTQLKPPDERTQICQEGLSAQGKLWPVDEPRCDLTSVRHQSIRVSVSVTLRATSQHDEHFARGTRKVWSVLEE